MLGSLAHRMTKKFSSPNTRGALMELAYVASHLLPLFQCLGPLSGSTLLT